MIVLILTQHWHQKLTGLAVTGIFQAKWPCSCHPKNERSSYDGDIMYRWSTFSLWLFSPQQACHPWISGWPSSGTERARKRWPDPFPPPCSHCRVWDGLRMKREFLIPPTPTGRDDHAMYDPTPEELSGFPPPVRCLHHNRQTIFQRTRGKNSN